MSIYPVRNVLYCMSKNPLCGQFIGSLVIKPCRTGVATFVWCMMTARGVHNVTKPGQKLMVRERLAVIISDKRDSVAAHPVFIVGQDFLVYWYNTVPSSGGLTFPNEIKPLIEFNVRFEYMQKFRRARATIAHHDNGHSHRRKSVFSIICNRLYAVQLPRIEGLFPIFTFRRVNVNKMANIGSRCDKLILDCIAVDVMHDLSHFFLHRMPDADIVLIMLCKSVTVKSINRLS